VNRLKIETYRPTVANTSLVSPPFTIRPVLSRLMPEISAMTMPANRKPPRKLK
jgi:hypothetical protein